MKQSFLHPFLLELKQSMAPPFSASARHKLRQSIYNTLDKGTDLIDPKFTLHNNNMLHNIKVLHLNQLTIIQKHKLPSPCYRQQLSCAH
jgi:hypothetical protein